MKQVNKRLSDLEGAAKPDRGHVVLWSDLDGDGYWDLPFYNHDRRRISEDDRRELEAEYDDLIVVKYVRDWRATNPA